MIRTIVSSFRRDGEKLGDFINKGKVGCEYIKKQIDLRFNDVGYKSEHCRREGEKEGGRGLHFCVLIIVDEAPSWRAD
jgi:hypothetical protein